VGKVRLRLGEKRLSRIALSLSDSNKNMTAWHIKQSRFGRKKLKQEMHNVAHISTYNLSFRICGRQIFPEYH
jgi:hypothetical protein